MNNNSFIFKYIPQNIEGIVGNTSNKIFINNYIKTKSKENIIFYGPCGVGKTLTYNIILKTFNTNNLVINLSDVRGI